MTAYDTIVREIDRRLLDEIGHKADVWEEIAQEFARKTAGLLGTYVDLSYKILQSPTDEILVLGSHVVVAIHRDPNMFTSTQGEVLALRSGVLTVLDSAGQTTKVCVDADALVCLATLNYFRRTLPANICVNMDSGRGQFDVAGTATFVRDCVQSGMAEGVGSTQEDP